LTERNISMFSFNAPALILQTMCQMRNFYMAAIGTDKQAGFHLQLQS